MRRFALPCALAALLVAAAPAQAAPKAAPKAKAHGKHGHAAKPRKQRAVRSQVAPDAGLGDDLWATVNLCDTPAKPGAVGVRVSMPPRGEDLAQWMRIRVQYFSDVDRTWRLVAAGGDSSWDRIGDGVDTVETGYTFTFQLPTAGHRLVLRGLVDLEWRKGDDVKDSTREMTEIGHVDATDELLGDSRSSCQISR